MLHEISSLPYIEKQFAQVIVIIKSQIMDRNKIKTFHKRKYICVIGVEVPQIHNNVLLEYYCQANAIR